MNVAVIGAGPAGLMAAEILTAGGARVTIYERMPSVGRKFLLAGRGGLNLTHSEPLDRFLQRYGNAEPHLHNAIDLFSPSALRSWSEELGQPTFVGSSGRVFPRAFKSSPLLRAWLRRLADSGVRVALRHRWMGWDDKGRLKFDTPDGAQFVDADVAVIALGGASWPKLGSDGAWIDPLQAKGIAVSPLKPANCGFIVRWTDMFRGRFEGHPLKGVMMSFGGHSARGEIMIARDGLEGGAIYALSSVLRDSIIAEGEAVVRIALRPDISTADLAARLGAPKNKQSFSTYLRKTISLSPAAIGLLQEAARISGKVLSAMQPDELAAFLNAVPICLTGIAPIGKAISTAGGIAFDEIDEHFMLRKLPGIFVAGEMLDWEAPTGGYLLQASFATGAAAGRGVLNYLKV